MKIHELTESQRKNTHLTHLEDLILYNGSKGVEQAIEYLKNVSGVLAGHSDKSRISTKLDGSPAVIAGIDPMDKKFFIGTKSVFNKSPKLVKNKYDLDRWYGDRPELYKKLYICLKYLKTLNFRGILQGDLLFTSDDLKTDTIEGEKYIIFKPNTITYAVPADSKMALSILKAKLGIAWHTQYSGGTSLSGMTASHDIKVPQSNHYVWSHSVNFKDYTGTITLTPKEVQVVNNGIAKLENLKNKMNDGIFDKVIQNKEFIKNVEPFINSRIRSGNNQVHTNIHEFIKDFIEYYSNKVMKGAETLRGGAEGVAGKRRSAKAQEFSNFVSDNYQTILAMLGIYKFVIQLKRILINKMSVMDGLKTFYHDGEDYSVTSHEGFVATDHIGNAVKLVNRLEFSKRNFNK